MTETAISSNPQPTIAPLSSVAARFLPEPNERRLSDRLPDDLADALGLVIAEQQEHWEREHTAFSAELRALLAEHRAIIVEQKSRIVELEAQLKGVVDEQVRRVDVALAGVKDGEPGPAGPRGDPGLTGADGMPGEKGDPGAPGERGPQGEPGAPGADAQQPTIEQIRAALGGMVEIKEAVQEAARVEYAANPPLNGKDGPPGERGPEGPIGPQGPVGEPGRAGIDGAPGQKGDLGDRGPEGPAGDPGRDGRDGLPGVAGAAGRDGANGKDGADGLGFDDYTEELSEDGRTRVRRWVRGDRVKEFREPVYGLRYCGVWKDGTYHRDDAVTWDGSVWIAVQDTSDKPEKSDAWKLAVRKGRDGKDGILKAEEPSKPIRLR